MIPLTSELNSGELNQFVFTSTAVQPPLDRPLVENAHQEGFWIAVVQALRAEPQLEHDCEVRVFGQVSAKAARLDEGGESIKPEVLGKVGRVVVWDGVNG